MSIESFLVLVLVLVVVLLGTAFVVNELFRKNVNIWIWQYLTSKNEKHDGHEPVHVMFAYCDHFEPQWGKADYEQEVYRVDRWCTEYLSMARRHQDADGCMPKHSFFYPEEEYREEHLDKLSRLCQEGCGEVEIHLHHDNDTAAGLTEKITRFLNVLDTRHGLVASDTRTGKHGFSFIHGNWALDNSRKDGRWCGVNNELSVLSDLGCYADFTLPSAPSDTQTEKVNSIYYAQGKDNCAKSHNNGVDVEVGKPPSGDLMIVQGPLCFNWRNRKYGIIPRIENSDIRSNSPPTQHRVDMWVNCGIQVKKQPQWRFVKIHTHGTQDCDIDTLLGEPTESMFSYLESRYNDGKSYVLHYVTAREMYNIIVAAEDGKKGNPNTYRDYVIEPPPNLKRETKK